MWALPPAITVLDALSLVALTAQVMTAASVSLVTGLFCSTAFGFKLKDEVWTALTFVLGLSFRLLAIRYKGRCRNSRSIARRNEEFSGGAKSGNRQLTTHIALRPCQRSSR
jgi:hypothetical protein